jgi:hypothetical protein
VTRELNRPPFSPGFWRPFSSPSILGNAGPLDTRKKCEPVISRYALQTLAARTPVRSKGTLARAKSRYKLPMLFYSLHRTEIGTPSEWDETRSRDPLFQALSEQSSSRPPDDSRDGALLGAF